ncbi:MAG TPA: redoxin domain-containing protein [Candidatus Krumholzibacteria bacterium]|nr:redoxin domain-containing protein [Candidatus Krumholzibacteria bacterium]
MPPSSLRKVLLVIALITGAALAIVAGNYVGHELAHRREAAKMADQVSGMNTGESSALRAGDPFPVVSLVTPPDSSGGTTRVSSSDLVAGRAALVFFLSTDCDPCTKAVQRWSQSIAEVPTSVLLFGIIDRAPEVRDAYVAENEVSFPVLSDSDDTFGREYDMGIYPTIVAVDANGTMVFVRHGVDEGLTPGVALEMLHAGIDEGH